MPARTGEQFLEALNSSKRDVVIHGERVTDKVGEHPAFRGVVTSYASLFDMQHDPAHRDILTYRSPSSGQPVGTAFMAPRTHADLVKRRKAFQLWAEETFGLAQDSLTARLLDTMVEPAVQIVVIIVLAALASRFLKRMVRRAMTRAKNRMQQEGK
jgi:aromatic ring hydroxylase